MVKIIETPSSNFWVAIELVSAFSYFPMSIGNDTVCFYLARITVYLYCLVLRLLPFSCKLLGPKGL